MTTPTQLFTLLDACFDAQNEATALWHSQEPEADDVAPDASASPETLLALVRAQHLRNFRLWHIEDTARRRDVTPDVIADCKYRIDRLNQERNDRIERVDACLVALLSPLLPASPAPHINTESLGMAIDRLSILSLKIWHMDEQVRRTDVTPEHIASCEKKLAIRKEPFWSSASFPLPQTTSPILLRLLRFEFRASPASGIEKQKCLMPE